MPAVPVELWLALVALAVAGLLLPATFLLWLKAFLALRRHGDRIARRRYRAWVDKLPTRGD